MNAGIWAMQFGMLALSINDLVLTVLADDYPSSLVR